MNNGDRTILLVDNLFEKIKRKHLRNKGYKLVCCGCGRDAIEKINNGLEYELIIICPFISDVYGGDVARVSRLRHKEVQIFSCSESPTWPPLYSDVHIQGSYNLQRIVDAHFNYLKH